MQLTHDEIMDKLDIQFFPSRITGYTLSPGIYEISDINTSVEDLSTDIVKISI